jgi:hypothetical protein
MRRRFHENQRYD